MTCCATSGPEWWRIKVELVHASGKRMSALISQLLARRQASAVVNVWSKMFGRIAILCNVSSALLAHFPGSGFWKQAKFRTCYDTQCVKFPHHSLHTFRDEVSGSSLSSNVLAPRFLQYPLLRALGTVSHRPNPANHYPEKI